MRKYWLAILAIGLLMGACDEAVNVNCGEYGCQFSDGQFPDGECNDGDIRCASENKGYLKCIDNQWKDFELCQNDKICDDELDRCVDGCKDNDFECIDDSAASYRVCENKDWVFKECDSGKICNNNQCIGPEVTEECQADAFECTGEFSYRTCVEEKWAEGNCENGKVCQNNACIPQPTSCEGSVFQCTDKFNYRKCVENKWVNEKCKDGKVCQNDACVPPEPIDCDEGKFLGCTQDKTQKQIQICNPQNVKNEPCDPGMICDTQSGGCIYTPAPPSDSCSYDKIKGELAKANLGCDDASKTFIISSSTNLSQLNNWHDNEKKSCLVFCGEIHLDTLTDSIPLPPNAKVIGVKEAKLGAEEVKEAKLSADELSKPLFIPYNKNKTDSIDSNTFKNLNIAIKKFLISHDGAHAVLADKAEKVTVENVSLSGTLRHNNEETIKIVGGLFGTVNGGNLKQIHLQDVSILLNKPNAYDVYGEKLDADYNSDIGGIVGLSTNSKLTISLPSASNITIESGMAARVGGLIGRTESDLDISGNPDHYSEIHDITITNAERDVSAVLGSTKLSNSSTTVTIKDLSVTVNRIQATFECAASLIGFMFENKLDVQNIELNVTNEIIAGNYSGGVFGFVENNYQTTINNIRCHVNKIHAKIDDILSKHESRTQGHGAGGIFGSIRAKKEDVSVSNVYLFANSIQSDKYAGGFVGDLRTGENKNYSFVHNSNVVKEITAREGVGGFIGFVKPKNKITIKELQNIVLKISTTNDNTNGEKSKIYPGGVIGQFHYESNNNYDTIKSITLEGIATYSERFYNDNKIEKRVSERAILADDNCNENHSLFKEAVFFDDYYIINKNKNSIACGKLYSHGSLSRIGSGNKCSENCPKGFTCTTVQIKDKLAPYIPLFKSSLSEPSIVDTAGNIQW